jgi:hypothetical protein
MSLDCVIHLEIEHVSFCDYTHIDIVLIRKEGYNMDERQDVQMNISKEQILDIIRLADESEEKYNDMLGIPEGIYSFNEVLEREKTPAGIAYENARRKLREYLNALEYRMLIEVETLMVYGRAYQQHNDPITVKSCFLDFSMYVNKPEGKPMAVLYIAGKIPLGKYLKEALLHCDPAKISLDV